ncbi:hypothetical protein [Neisseria gonorrhoeae]|uniref:hypothetical protein n=1 Tax=Neisseria gonorrhoeae TaxID=485 RepID=UPI00384F3DED
MNGAEFTLTPQNKKQVMRSIWDSPDGWFENGNLETAQVKTERRAEQAAMVFVS